MRRKEREVLDKDEIERIIRQCMVCHVSIHHAPYPYIVPLNFGYARDGDVFFLFFHCAMEGKKLRLMRQNPFVSFSMECNTRLVTGEIACAYSMEYESVCGSGTISLVSDEEKTEAFEAIMRQYAPNRSFSFPPEALSNTVLLRLKVSLMTGKRNIRTQSGL